MRIPRALMLTAILVSPAAKAADPSAANPSRFTPVISSIPVQEVGLPETIRTDGREFLIVPWRAEGAFWVLDAETGERRKVNVSVPEGVSQVSIRCVERMGKGRLVASAAWEEREAAISGLLFMDDEGNVDRHAGYDFSVGSIAVGPTGDWIVASIQQPQGPTLERTGSRVGHGIAQFDSDGELGPLQYGALGNMVGSFEESAMTHGLRKVFLNRNTVVLTYPFLRKGESVPVVWIEGSQPYASKAERAKRKAGSSQRRDHGGSLAPLHWPRLGEERFRGAKPIGIVPVVSDGKSAYLAAWLTRGSGEPEDPEPTAPRRDRGRLLLALYDTEGKEARKVEEVEDGTRIGELTASPDGTAYAVTFSDISKEWSISRVDF